MLIGGDFLGLAFYEKAAIKASVAGDVCGVMPETFKGPHGNGWKAVEATGKSKKFSEEVVHITPFDNSHKYPIQKNRPLIRKNVLRMQKLAEKYPETIWMISFFCEHQHPRSVIEPLFHEMKTLAPKCLFVNSIIGKGEEVPGMITEIHLESSKTLPKKPRLEYVVSFDGFGGNKKHPGDFPDANIEEILKKYPDARHVRHWNARHSGKYSPTQDKPPLPNNRTCWPNVNYLKGHRECLTPREGNLTWSKNELLKPFADDHDQGGKDNKLLAILPSKAGFAEVLDTAGNVIDKLTSFGPHNGTPAGTRYYSQYYACQVAERAVRRTGSRLVRVRAGDKTYPLTDCALRSSIFR